MQPVADETVAGKYRLTRLIGRGGMGSVWEGVHLTLGTRVAIKFIDGAIATNPDAVHRFENEARAAACLNSKYVVQIYDHGMMADGRPFIVMEFLTGEPLDARLERERRVAPAETVRILTQVCRALQRAHSVGIVHRDLKPENIFLVWDDEDQSTISKVVDFGIAKFTGNQLAISSSTRTGTLLGTPYYMSPEQARGLRTLDHRTDLWSLGVIAYRCLVGRLPFEGENIGDLLVKICTAPLPVPSLECRDCPPGFDAWFLRAMQREPMARFSSATELAEQLGVALLGASSGNAAMSVGGHVVAGGAPGFAGAGISQVVSGVTAGGPTTTTGAALTNTATVSEQTKRSLKIVGAIGIALLLAVGLLIWSWKGSELVANEVAVASAAETAPSESASTVQPVSQAPVGTSLVLIPAAGATHEPSSVGGAKSGSGVVTGASPRGGARLRPRDGRRENVDLGY